MAVAVNVLLMDPTWNSVRSGSGAAPVSLSEIPYPFRRMTRPSCTIATTAPGTDPSAIAFAMN